MYKLLLLSPPPFVSLNSSLILGFRLVLDLCDVSTNSVPPRLRDVEEGTLRSSEAFAHCAGDTAGTLRSRIRKALNTFRKETASNEAPSVSRGQDLCKR